MQLDLCTMISHSKNNLANPVTRNRTRDHLIAAIIYSQMLYQLSYDRDDIIWCLVPTNRTLPMYLFATNLEDNSSMRQGGGIEPLHVSMPHELKSCPSTSLTHPGIRCKNVKSQTLCNNTTKACLLVTQQFVNLSQHCSADHVLRKTKVLLKWFGSALSNGHLANLNDSF